jgi:hypothetical protein
MPDDSILIALKKQLVCYQALAKLAQAQHLHVQNCRTEDLLAVLTQRQQVLEQVSQLEETIGPAKKRWADYLAALSPADRDQAETFLAETRRLLEEITTADRNDAIALQQRKMNLGSQINQATVARQINRKYAAAAYGGGKAALDLQR